MNIIETHNLCRRFGRTEAVRNLDLVLPEGCICSLLGSNGAGKSTAIKVLMNLLRPSSGEASVLGVDTRRLSPSEFAKIGYVAESQKLPLWMTVRQLLDYCRTFYPAWDRELESRLLRQFDLPEDRPLKHLSRGMTMKAALLSSLAYHPKLLVLDEPFSGLDPVVREDLVRAIIDTAAAGEWTVLISSHDIEEVERMTDRVALLEKGQLRLHEPVDRLLQRFRRVSVEEDEGALREPADGSMPASWIGFQGAGRRYSFIDTQFDRDATERMCRERFPSAAVVATPMSLRDIFIALSRDAQPLGSRLS